MGPRASAPPETDCRPSRPGRVARQEGPQTADAILRTTEEIHQDSPARFAHSHIHLGTFLGFGSLNAALNMGRKRAVESHMATPSRSRILTGALLIGLILVSCNDSPTQPSPPPQPPTGGPPVILTTELVAPSSIAPGESQQLTLTARWSDGTTTDVTSQAVWQGTNSRVLTVTPSGVVTGVANGEASVSARHANQTRFRALLVLPTGTFRLRGQVKEADLGLDGVAISVDSAPGVRQTSISGFGGGYVFYGLAGRVAIEARKDGYLPKVDQVDVVEDRTFDVQLAPARARTDFSGHWALTISASTCRSTRFGPMPDEAKTRRYSATLTQEGPRVRLVLADAEFVIVGGKGNTLTGTTDPNDAMQLTLYGPNDFYYYYYRLPPDLVERLNDGRQLVISGSVTASGDSRRVAGTLSGSFLLKSSTGVNAAECSAADHRFEMVR
jgi:hypothetical protein